MPNIVERIPQMSNGDLQRLLQNVNRILAAPGHQQHENALATRDAISSEWKRRAARNEWFPWPTTDALGGDGSLTAAGWPDEGMLRYLGYHVGETNPTPEVERRLILDYAFEKDLPPLNDSQYYSAWGECSAPERLSKLANTIAAFARNAKRRDPIALARAIREWESDLEYLRQKYYIGFFNFGFLVTKIPRGIPTLIAIKIATVTKYKCSVVR